MLGSWAPSTYSLGKFNIPTYLLESAKSSSRALPARERESTSQGRPFGTDGRLACLLARVRASRSLGDITISSAPSQRMCNKLAAKPPASTSTREQPTPNWLCKGNKQRVSQQLAICHVAQHRGRVAVPVAEPQPRARRRRRSTEPSRSFRGAPWSQSKH